MFHTGIYPSQRGYCVVVHIMERQAVKQVEVMEVLSPWSND